MGRGGDEIAAAPSAPVKAFAKRVGQLANATERDVISTLEPAVKHLDGAYEALGAQERARASERDLERAAAELEAADRAIRAAHRKLEDLARRSSHLQGQLTAEAHNLRRSSR